MAQSEFRFVRNETMTLKKIIPPPEQLSNNQVTVPSKASVENRGNTVTADMDRYGVLCK